MRRIVLTFAAVAIAAVVCSPGSAAAFVYSCVPGTGVAQSSVHLYLNNAQVVTANVTLKLQASTGANLNAAHGVTQTFTIAAGNTKIVTWTVTCTGACSDLAQGTNATTVPVNVRVVSDQELGVGLNIAGGGDHPMQCNQSG